MVLGYLTLDILPNSLLPGLIIRLLGRYLSTRLSVVNLYIRSELIAYLY